MKVLICGAHFTPALALIQELKKDKQTEIVYVGRKNTQEGDKTRSFESQVIPEYGVKFISLVAGRLQRSLTIYTIPALLKIPVGFIQSIVILLREKPSVVVSFGGYIGVPIVITSWLFSIPVLIHEQTLVPSLANRISGFFASKIALSFKENKAYPEEKVVLTGNPIRREFIENKHQLDKQLQTFIDNAKLDNKPIIFVTGGNQGSHFFNTLVLDQINQLLEKFYLIHQVGDSKFKDFDKINTRHADFIYPKRYLYRKWFDVSELVSILKHTDLAISRAGVNTLLELTYLKVPVVVVPINNHYEQQANAEYFSKIGLADSISEGKLKDQSLVQIITKNLNRQLKINYDHKLSTDSAKRLALEVKLLIQN